MLEDEHLIRRLRRGDKESLRRVYEKYKDKLLTMAAGMLNDTGAAEDILHDVFVAFAGGIKKFHLYGSLENYLTTCVVNRVRDRFRRKQYEVVDLWRVGPLGGDEAQPEQSAMFNEQSQVLADALARIPFEQREVIILHVKGGMRFREIAVMQGVSISTVQGRYRYGLEKLRSIVNGEAIR
ncbi:MAG: RNA polymerase sigma factor [Planctomycetota bacterium]|jgi:RNA polymerase sigma-70 factor (ECF subfamily)